MPDTYDSETRSRVMRQVKGRDTKPELLLRQPSGPRGCVATAYTAKTFPASPMSRLSVVVSQCLSTARGGTGTPTSGG